MERVSFEKFIFTRENEDDFYRGLRGGEFDNCLLITKDPNCVGKHILFYICQKIGFYIQKVFFHLGFKRCEIDEELCHSAILLRAGSRYSFTVPGKEARFGYKQLEAHALARGVVINQENSLRPPTKDASEVVIFRPVDRAFREAVGLTARATAVDERRPGNAGFKRLRFSLKTLCQSIFSPQIKDQLQEKDALHALMGAVDVLRGRAFRDKDNNPIHGLCSTYTYRVIQAARVISKLTLNEREEIAYETIRGAELNVQDTRLWDTLLRPEGFAKLNADARARLSHYLRELVPSFVPEESREGVAGVDVNDVKILAWVREHGLLDNTRKSYIVDTILSGEERVCVMRDRNDALQAMQRVYTRETGEIRPLHDLFFSRVASPDTKLMSINPYKIATAFFAALLTRISQPTSLPSSSPAV
ncbi:MAG: hypothetical protein A3F09_06115 [Chlamydiae bacterium RIFCSPHIGHO2_12_FULL_49_11]|nr:MAG: hypothetical protein A3F09_06115 [Chlamydiae bacterium RIFCSPHIGHO2_12_FULL_49_11]